MCCVVLFCAAATSTTPSAKTSSHMTPCSESEKKFCVNGGKCYTLEVTPGNIKHLCRYSSHPHVCYRLNTETFSLLVTVILLILDEV